MTEKEVSLKFELMSVAGAVLKTTDNWVILRFSPEGKIIRHYGLNKSVGFQTDEVGRVIIKDD